MDDFPAGPASPSPRRPPLSVVIPVNNGGRDFERCLRGLRESSWADYELIVIDDASTDDSATVAGWFGARVIRHSRKLGPAAARNAGALAASASLLFFIDADVEVHPEAMARALSRLGDDPDLVGLFGSYDARPAAPGLVSQFRNLLHHFVHQSGGFVDDIRPVQTFWTGCGLVRRSVFLESGGFDPQVYRRPAIEDIELGYRITSAGHRIVLARDVLATHLKCWTLWDMVRTDIFRRGIPWMLLMKRSRIVEKDLNVSKSQRACVAVTGLGLLGTLGTPWIPALLGLLPLTLSSIVALNFDFYRFLTRRKGLSFAMASTWLHLIYFCCCGLSVVIAEILWIASRRALGNNSATVTPGQRLDRGESGSPVPAALHASSRRRSRTR